MIVKHIGADGRVRQTYVDVSSIRLAADAVVFINRTATFVDSRTSPYAWATETPKSIIHLAPGESVERTDDEPARS